MNAETLPGKLWPTGAQHRHAQGCLSTAKCLEPGFELPMLPAPPSKYALTLEEIGHLLDAGVMMLERRHTVRAATTLARAYLLADTGLAERSGKLQFRRSSAERNFTAFLEREAARAKSRSADGEPPELFGVPDPEGRIRYVMWHLSWLGEAPEDCVTLAVVDLAAGARGLQRSGIAAVFGLSAREAQLAELFSMGLRLEQIAKQMGVTLNTARVHLHHVFLKTNCPGQLELARAFARIHAITDHRKPAHPAMAEHAVEGL